jgi:hypothetical protein
MVRTCANRSDYRSPAAALSSQKLAAHIAIEDEARAADVAR